MFLLLFSSPHARWQLLYAYCCVAVFHSKMHFMCAHLAHLAIPRISEMRSTRMSPLFCQSICRMLLERKMWNKWWNITMTHTATEARSVALRGTNRQLKIISRTFEPHCDHVLQLRIATETWTNYQSRIGTIWPWPGLQQPRLFTYHSVVHRHTKFETKRFHNLKHTGHANCYWRSLQEHELERTGNAETR